MVKRSRPKAVVKESEGRELKGCLIFVAIAVVLGGGGWLVRDFVDFSSLTPEPPKPAAVREAPPVTKVTAMKEKTVVDHPTEGKMTLARKLVAPPLTPPAGEGQAAAPPGGTAMGIEGMTPGSPTGAPQTGGIGPGSAAPGSPPAGQVSGAGGAVVLSQMADQAVCYNGSRARRVDSLYHLPGGFAIVYGAGEEGSEPLRPRLEFMPGVLGRDAGGPDTLYYASFADAPVSGFESGMARPIANTDAAVGRVILSWVAAVANGPCPPMP
ncbi:hypothetical protein [Rhodospirillum rubrum]|uniref:hypothetical protein n=1 Tax=Rhodospirillum rubrum TaxID=1085 RepID=UPI001F5B2D90|nr:hypothetical protein [Rhodospirillum rubrum]